MRLIGYVGVPTAFAGVLLYILATWAPKLAQQQMIIIAQQETIAKQNDEIVKVLRQISETAKWHCYLVARNNDERRDCYTK